MEERNNITTPAEEPKKCCCGCGWGAFIVGLVAALILGWWVLPDPGCGLWGAGTLRSPFLKRIRRIVSLGEAFTRNHGSFPLL